MTEKGTYDSHRTARALFEKAIRECITDGEGQYANFTNCIYNAIFSKDESQYRKILGLTEGQSVRENLPREVLDAVETFEIAFSGRLRSEAADKGRLLSPEEGTEVFRKIEIQSDWKPVARRARDKMEEKEAEAEGFTLFDFAIDAGQETKKDAPVGFVSPIDAAEAPAVPENEENAAEERYTQIIQTLEEVISDYQSVISQYESLTKEYHATIKEQGEIIETQRELIENRKAENQESSPESEETDTDTAENTDARTLELTISGYEEVFRQCEETIKQYQDFVDSQISAAQNTEPPEANRPFIPPNPPTPNPMPIQEYQPNFRDFMVKVGDFIDEMNQNLGPGWYLFPLALIVVLLMKAFY